jgi:lipoprotein LprG
MPRGRHRPEPARPRAVRRLSRPSEDTILRAVGALAGVATLSAAVTTLSACGSSKTFETDPRALLHEAKQVVDSTPALHFAITSQNATGSGVFITGGDGDAARPDRFAGTIAVSLNGIGVNIRILSVGGVFSVSLLGGAFTPTDPGKYGFEDPAKLIDPNAGLSSLLNDATSASLGDRDRFPGSGEELYEVMVDLPGDRVKALLPDADPAKPVKGTVGIEVDTHQVRRVVLTGPLLDAAKDSTFTLVLDRYGESVSITPATGG